MRTHPIGHDARAKCLRLCVLQSGGAAWEGLKGSLSPHGSQGGVTQVDGIKGRVATFLGQCKRYRTDGPSASLKQLSTEGVKSSHHVRLLMIAPPRDLASIKGNPFPIPECERRQG
jgi:hypothetical protein